MSQQILDPVLVARLREQLVRYARWDNAGYLNHYPDAWLAERIRRIAPGLADAGIDETLEQFGELVLDVAAFDCLLEAPGPWLGPGQLAVIELEVFRIRVDCSLYTLVPGQLR